MRPFGTLRDRDLAILAQKLADLLGSVHDRFIAIVGLNSDTVIAAFLSAQSSLLEFEDPEFETFQREVEEKRVKTLSGDNIFMVCLLCSMIALTIQRRSPTKMRLLFRLLKNYDTLTLLAFSVTSFYTVIGTSATSKLRQLYAENKNTLNLGRAVRRRRER